jgi:2-isopropylmalate synthase
MSKKIEIYDTTLRDGSQSEDVSFSVEDKLIITEKLDSLGVHYVEGGWPLSNPKDVQYFKEAAKLRLNTAVLAAFGSTQKPGVASENDENLKCLLEAETPVVTIFGKTWDLHVKKALRISEDDNLRLIHESLSYLKKRREKVFFDAEHFFDGYKKNRAYAIKCLHEAVAAGADCLVLCDTNGGCLPHEVGMITAAVRAEFDSPIGIHVHNDSDCAVANTIMAVEAGARQVQGTINGLGERCGNANLCSVIPDLQVKLAYECLPPDRLNRLREVSRFVNEVANLRHFKRQPFVGDSAFAHKGGIHVSAVSRSAETYEHINPEVVGNTQRILISDLSGRSNIMKKAEEFGIDLSGGAPPETHGDAKAVELAKKAPVTPGKPEVKNTIIVHSQQVIIFHKAHDLLKKLKEQENTGYQYEAAEASFELLMRRSAGIYVSAFELVGFRVIVEKRALDEKALTEATVKIKLPDGTIEHTASEGNGPVNALDNALRKALITRYPDIDDVKLHDYKVRVLTPGQGTATNVRVLIESGDGNKRWGTVGVSENVIEASWLALVDSIEYKLLKK